MSIPRLFDDRQQGLKGLTALLMAPNALIFELGNTDGLVFFDMILPHFNANVHVIVFRRKNLPELDDMLKALGNWMFRTFDLRILSSWIPAFNTGAQRLCDRLGFTLDGVTRSSLVYNGELVDAFVYSITREEALG